MVLPFSWYSQTFNHSPVGASVLTQLMYSAHASQPSKWCLDRFSGFCTAHPLRPLMDRSVILECCSSSRLWHSQRVSITISPASTGSDSAGCSLYDVILIMTSFVTKAGPWALVNHRHHKIKALQMYGRLRLTRWQVYIPPLGGSVSYGNF